MRTIQDFNVKNKRVLVRCDLNVPLDSQGNILDDFRIKKTIPTIEYLFRKEAKVILISHLGRPLQNPSGPEALSLSTRLSRAGGKGRRQKYYSLKSIAQRLEKLIEKKVKFLDDCIGAQARKEIDKMKVGEIFLLENLRFHKGETQRDLKFAKALSELGDIYINDAFSVCHRGHASIVGIPRYLPSGVGFLIKEEIRNLKRLMEKPEKPMVVIIGGKKVETKANLINKILKTSDFLLIGELIKKELDEKRIVLKEVQKLIVPIDSIRKDGKDLDIGPKTINLFKEKILKAKTIFWNGPLGMTEKDEFLKGTLEIAKAIVKSRAFSVVGGGETVEFLNRKGLTSKFSHISTGGGAMLQFLGGEKLQGLEVLEKV